MIDRTGEIRSTRAPTLREDQIEILGRYGQTKKTAVGQVLFRAGDTSNDFIVVLEGEVEVVDDFAGEARTMGVMRAGRFVGDLNMLTGQAIYLSAVVREGGEVLAIPRERLKEVVTEEPNLSDIILKAFLARRSWGMRTGLGLRIIGSRHSGDASRLRGFAARNRLPHVWIELEEDPKAEALLEEFGAEPSETPVTIWQGKDMLKNPTNAELARVIGLNVEAPRQRTDDLVVVEAGPAGLGASVYGASEGLSTLVLESVALGGQAGTSSRIENYLGFPAGLSGFELATRALVQADKFGARSTVPQEAVGLKSEDGHYRIGLFEGGEVAARSVIAATGARYRRLEVPRLARFEGVSVHYAATEAEVQPFEGEEVVVVGGGNSAGQATVFLAGRTRRVQLLIRGDDLGKGMSRYLVDRVMEARNVELLANTEIRDLVGEDRLDGVMVEDNRSGAPDPRGASPFRLHRGGGQHRLAPRCRRTRRTRLRPDGQGAGRLCARGGLLARPFAATVPAGDEPAGRVRGGRRTQRLDQAGRLRGGGGLYGGEVGPSVPGRCRRAKSVRILPLTALEDQPHRAVVVSNLVILGDGLNTVDRETMQSAHVSMWSPPDTGVKGEQDESEARSHEHTGERTNE